MSESETNKTTFHIHSEEELHIHKPLLQKIQQRSLEVFNHALGHTRLFFRHNYYLNYPFKIVQKCNNKNTIAIGDRKIKYSDRKMAVIGLSLGSALIQFVKLNSSFKVRWLIPYYLFFSLLFCRENLNPFL